MKENEFALSISRDSFYKTSMFIYDNFGFNIDYSFSLIVNEAIACELSIKTMLEKLNIAYSKSHSLFDLLSLLPGEIQQEIVNTISNELNHPQETVIKDIQILSYAVVDWRYLDKAMVIEFNTLHQLMLILYKLSKQSVYYEITKVENPTRSEEEVDKEIAEYSIKALNENAKRINNERKKRMKNNKN